MNRRGRLIVALAVGVLLSVLTAVGMIAGVVTASNDQTRVNGIAITVLWAAAYLAGALGLSAWVRRAPRS